MRQDPGTLGAQLDRAEAAVDEARARLSELRRGPRSERIEQAQARLRGARSRLETAQHQLQRARDLVDRELIARSELDERQSQRDSALAAVKAGRAELQALLTGTTLEQLQQAEAAYRQAQARHRELRIMNDRLTVRAPRPGTLDALPFLEGERPPAGATVAVLLASEPLLARVYVPEPRRRSLQAGTRVKVHVDGLDTPLPGRIRFIASEAAFTPFFALTEHDRSRLSFLAEIELHGEHSAGIPAGVPVQVSLAGDGDE